MTDNFDIWRFLAGLGVFLFGMFFIEQSLKNLAGRSFKRLLRHYTNTPLKGIIVGILVTAILQSSSVVSLIVLAFVGAGILKLKNAVGVIFGTNLGTTFTGWIVVLLGFSLNIETLALPFLAFGGVILMFFAKYDKILETGHFLLGFGLLFLGLDFMKSSMDILSQDIGTAIFQDWNPYYFFPIGLVLTAVIQSSSAVMVIALSALSSGLLTLDSAAVLIIGSDLGTTITTVLGAIRGTSSKKRVAASHVLINIFTAGIALIILYPLLSFITNVLNFDSHLYTLVCFHSTFNLIGITLMFPFISLFSRFLERMFKSGKDQMARYITKAPVKVPEAAIETLRLEMTDFIDRAIQMGLMGLHIVPNKFAFKEKVGEREDGLFGTDNYLEVYDETKQLQGEIVEYFVKIQGEKLEKQDAASLEQYIHAIRNTMASIKQIKDINHNVKELENSSHNSKRKLYFFLKEQEEELYFKLYTILNSENKAAMYEQLYDALKENHHVYERFIKEVYGKIGNSSLNEMDLATLLTVNREIHAANKNLILAMKDALLSNEEADSFNALSVSE